MANTYNLKIEGTGNTDSSTYSLAIDANKDLTLDDTKVAGTSYSYVSTSPNRYPVNKDASGNLYVDVPGAPTGGTDNTVWAGQTSTSGGAWKHLAVYCGHICKFVATTATFNFEGSGDYHYPDTIPLQSKLVLDDLCMYYRFYNTPGGLSFDFSHFTSTTRKDLVAFGLACDNRSNPGVASFPVNIYIKKPDVTKIANDLVIGFI